MDVVKTIRPGEPGSQRFVRQWGEQLIAVRYRKAPDGTRMLTTIEIVVEERQQDKIVNYQSRQTQRRADVVAVQIHWPEDELRRKVEIAGARWSPQLKLWLMRRSRAIALGIAERIVEGAAEQCEDVDISYQV